VQLADTEASTWPEENMVVQGCLFLNACAAVRKIPIRLPLPSTRLRSRQALAPPEKRLSSGSPPVESATERIPDCADTAQWSSSTGTSSL
jgi:hypothetical protein